MTAPNQGNVDPIVKRKRQEACVHRFDAWYVPHWDVKHKYRACLNCDYVEIKPANW